MKPGAATRDLELHLSANPASPLFARLAEQYLRNGELSRAERLCERGLETYPHYPTGLLIYSRCLAARGRYAEALGTIAGVASRYPGNIVLDGIETEWEALAGAANGAGGPDDAVFTDLDAGVGAPGRAESADIMEAAEAVDVAEVAEVVKVADVVPGIGADTPVEDVAGTPSASDQIEPAVGLARAPGTADSGAGVETDGIVDASTAPMTLVAPAPAEPGDASSIRPGDGDGMVGAPAPMPVPAAGSAPVPLLPPVPRPRKGRGFIERDRIISRTLAEIYASQGAIGEAVETYRILLRRMPEQRESLEWRLRELEERLRNEPGERPRPVE